jgi:FtsH-binding integral membrane protein
MSTELAPERVVFVQRVYAALFFQFVFTSFVVNLWSSDAATRVFVQNHAGLYYASIVVMAVLWITLTCVRHVLILSPRTNIAALIAFTCCKTYLLVTVTCFHPAAARAILQGLWSTVFVTFAILMCMIRCQSFTRTRLLLWTWCFVAPTSVLFHFFPLIGYEAGGAGDVLKTLWAGFVVFVYMSYFAYDTFVVATSYPLDAPLAAALSLYLDIFGAFLATLQVAGATNRREFAETLAAHDNREVSSMYMPVSPASYQNQNEPTAPRDVL